MAASPALAPSESEGLRFRVFARAWSACVLLGMISQEMATSPARIVVVILAALTLVLPSAPALLGLGIAYVVHYAVDAYRHVYVHTWVLAIASATIAVALLVTASRDAARWRERFLRQASPVLVAMAGTLFFCAGFAKLNDAFSDPATSCAPVFYASQRVDFPFSLLPDARWAERAVIPFTQVSEIMGGLLLAAHWRTRKLGFVVAWNFLMITGTNPLGRLYEFTSIFMALASAGFDYRPVRWRIPTVVAWALRVAVVLLVAKLATMDHAGVEQRRELGVGLYVVGALALLVTVLWSGRAVPLRAGAGPARWISWSFYAVAVLHEILPYAGLRNEQNLTMAAGLAVGPRWSNHRIVQHVPELPFNHSVVIGVSSDPFLRSHRNDAWPDWAFFDYLARHPGSEATVEIDGTTVHVDGTDPRARPSFAAAVLKPLPTDATAHRIACGKPRLEKKAKPKRPKKQEGTAK